MKSRKPELMPICFASVEDMAAELANRETQQPYLILWHDKTLNGWRFDASQNQNLLELAAELSSVSSQILRHVISDK